MSNTSRGLDWRMLAVIFLMLFATMVGTYVGGAFWIVSILANIVILLALIVPKLVQAQCGKCGGQNSEIANYCQKCGGRLSS